MENQNSEVQSKNENLVQINNDEVKVIDKLAEQKNTEPVDCNPVESDVRDDIKTKSHTRSVKTLTGEKTLKMAEKNNNPMHLKIEEEFNFKFAEFSKTDYMEKVKEKQLQKAKDIFDKFKEEGKEDGEAFISTMKQFEGLNKILSDMSGVVVEPKDEYYIKQINRRAICTQFILWMLFFVLYISISIVVDNWLYPLLGIIVFTMISAIIHNYFKIKKLPHSKKKKR